MHHNRCVVSRKLQLRAQRWSSATGGYRVSAQRRLAAEARESFETPSPLGCSPALRGIERTSNTPPDVKVEIIITTRTVSDESLTLLPSHAAAYLTKKNSKLH